MLRGRTFLGTGERRSLRLALRALVSLCVSWWKSRYDPARHYMRGPGHAYRAMKGCTVAPAEEAPDRRLPADGEQLEG